MLPIECFCFNEGDLDGDSFFDAVDLAFVIDIVFFGQPDVLDPGCPMTRSDFNCDGFADAVDLAEPGILQVGERAGLQNGRFDALVLPLRDGQLINRRLERH